MADIGELGYPTTVTRVDGLTITDHSAKFEVAMSNDGLAKGVVRRFIAGSRRLVTYQAAGFELDAEITDAHPDGYDRSSAELVWQTDMHPRYLPRTVLDLGMPEAAWEYTKISRNKSKWRFTHPTLTKGVARRVAKAHTVDIININTDEMSLHAQTADVSRSYRDHGIRRHEIVTVHTLGLKGAGVILTGLLERTLPDSMREHLPVIIANEPEIFS